MTPQEAIEKAAKSVGSQTALAALLGVKPPTVHQWMHGERPIPPARAVEIEQKTNRAVLRQDLCPDFPWDSPKKSGRKAA